MVFLWVVGYCCFLYLEGYSSDIDDLRTKIKDNEVKVEALLKRIKKVTSVSRMRVVSQRGMIRVLEVTRSQTQLANEFPELIRSACQQIPISRIFSQLRIQLSNRYIGCSMGWVWFPLDFTQSTNISPTKCFIINTHCYFTPRKIS